MRSVDYDISVQEGGDSEDKAPASFCDQKENVTPPANASDEASTDSCHGNDIGKANTSILDKASAIGNGRKAALQLFEKSQLKDAMRLAGANQPVAFEKLGERWEVAVSLSWKEPAEQATFINGIRTTTGGDHAAYIADQVAAHLVDVVSPKIKRRRITIKPSDVKKHLSVFVNYLEGATTATSSGPTRDYRTIYPTDFGSECKLSDKFLNKVGHALAFEVFKDVRMLRAKVGIA